MFLTNVRTLMVRRAGRAVVPLAGPLLMGVLACGPAAAAPPSFQAAIQAGGPALWYQLNEASGNAINFGTLGAAFDATYNGTPVRQAATLGGDTGVGLDSADDFLESLGNSPLTGNPTFSIETLLFLPTNGSANLYGPFLHWGDGGGGDGNPGRTGKEVYFSVSNNSLNRPYAGFYNAGARTSNTVPLGQWLDIVWTRQGGNDSLTGTTVYINGVPVALEQDPVLNPGFLSSAAINVTSTAFRINRARDFIGSRFFTGTMDEIALYDRVLSPAEVSAHFSALAAAPEPATLALLTAALPLGLLLRLRYRRNR